MNEVHNSHARDDLPLSGGEGAIPEKWRYPIRAKRDSLHMGWLAGASRDRSDVAE